MGIIDKPAYVANSELSAGLYGQDFVTCTATAGKECAHGNGWYDRIGWWIFTKRVFCCSDCWTILDAETKKPI